MSYSNPTMVGTSYNTALALHRMRSSVTGGALGREVYSRDNLLYAGSLMKERYVKSQ